MFQNISNTSEKKVFYENFLLWNWKKSGHTKSEHDRCFLKYRFHKKIYQIKIFRLKKFTRNMLVTFLRNRYLKSSNSVFDPSSQK